MCMNDLSKVCSHQGRCTLSGVVALQSYGGGRTQKTASEL